MIKIGIIDDEVLFSNGLKEILEREKNFEVFQVYKHPDELLQQWQQSPLRPDVLLMDIKMPKINGIELTKMLAEKSPDVKIIGLSSHYSKVLIFKMLKLGAAAYIPKNVSIDRLVRTINNVYEQGFYFEDIALKSFYNKTLRQKDEKELFNHGLTNREMDILMLICEQLTNQEIADKLFISLKTVENHRTNLFAKINAKNVVGAVLFALEHKLIDHSII
ncbi:response regulator transcription factor [Croceimicrobium hydrocarbonivorans]|uniref:Response regulator transcription factor n=1 Tax=Croceimicrobium hydrocarbonivorans TaxID=2761580 RepID=A0A7H0VFQ4_9FLAO|nr:response regulator transcription factor [Croceimicrobium hydrocarbonivorans]QNR24552.1 response regulator transcription factor [Croceimicrobium hydrocarbonivorans]